MTPDCDYKLLDGAISSGHLCISTLREALQGCSSSRIFRSAPLKSPERRPLIPTGSLTPFYKYSGAGNDFILIEGPSFPLDRPALIRRLCHRQMGIGADGLLLLDRSPNRMRIFNADGGEAEMCGNGLRCCAKHLLEEGEECEIEVSGQIYCASRSGPLISVSMPPPTRVEWNFPLHHDAIATVDLLDTGVPHVVHFVEQLDEVAVEELGWAIRHHPRLAPGGANVNFAKLDDQGDLSIRTYERGVEGETLACGTGVVAAALAAAHRTGRVSGPICVTVRSGERLTVQFNQRDDTIQNLTTEGPAQLVYQGHVDLNSLIEYSLSL